MFGVKEFGAILPPGTGSILAVSAALPKVVQLKNGHFGVQKSMMVTITCDHRHIYGADAAQFLKDLAGKREREKKRFENKKYLFLLYSFIYILTDVFLYACVGVVCSVLLFCFFGIIVFIS